MSEEISENDILENVRGFGTPAPSHVLENVMDVVLDLEREKLERTVTEDEELKRTQQRSR